MLVATAIAAVMTAGVLFVVAGMGRERAALAKRIAKQPPRQMLDLLRWDLANAEAMISSPRGDGLILIGHGGLDRSTLAPNGRLARVAYQVERSGNLPRLVREQSYLDDRARPEPWRELVLRRVDKLYALPVSMQLPAPLPDELAQVAGRGAQRLPQRLRVVVQRGPVKFDQEIRVQ
jgi:hypothetical protein